VNALARFVATFARSGARRDQGRAFATRDASSGTKGSGAPLLRPAPLALIAALALLALTAAPASAKEPTVTTGSVSEVSYSSVHLTGAINPQGAGNIKWGFQYTTTPGDPTSWSSENAPKGSFEDATGSTPLPVQGDLTDLRGSTTYYVRMTGSYEDAGETLGVFSSAPYPQFTTLPVDPPTVLSITNASNISYTVAKAVGEVERPANPASPPFDPNPGFNTKCFFEYVGDAQFKESGFATAAKAACNGNPVTTPGASTVNAELTGLNPATTYHLRLRATNAGGFSTKVAASTFTTLGPAIPTPTVLAADNAADVLYTIAKASGEVQRAGGSATDPALYASCNFEYITDAQFVANQTASLSGFEGASPVGCEQAPFTTPDSKNAVTASLSGLAPGTTYHLRLSAFDAGGTDSKAAASTFTTLGPTVPKPVVIATDNASEVFFTTAKATGKVERPGGPGAADPTLDTSCNFEYITDAQFVANQTASLPGFEGASPVGCEQGPFTEPDAEAEKTVSANLGGLAPGTTYHLRLSAFNGSGSDSKAAAATFTTQVVTPPTVTLDPITVHTDTTAHIGGKIDTKAPAGPLSPAAEAAYKTEWKLVCNPDCPSIPATVDGVLPFGGTVEATEGSHTFSINVTELVPNTTYEVTLTATNGAEPGNPHTSVKSFTTTLIPATVKALPGAPDGKGGYNLQGIVHPHNSNITSCEFKYGPNLPYAYSAPCSPTPGKVNKPVTVEAHLTGLTPGANYHALLVVTNAAGTKDGGDIIFVPTLDPTQSCPGNEQARAENSSLALPECRAYEMVSPPNKQGYAAEYKGNYKDDTVLYASRAGNIANSGYGELANNRYTTVRTPNGWETVPNLNGPSGSVFDGPEGFLQESYGYAGPTVFSEDLRSSIWYALPGGKTPKEKYPYLRNPDGSFTRIGTAPFDRRSSLEPQHTVGASADLSHLVLNGLGTFGTLFGPGVYEYVGVGGGEPRRVDLDNAGDPISTCANAEAFGSYSTATGTSVSRDGRVITFKAGGGCGGVNPPARGVWARVDGTTTYYVSASQCTRTVGDPGGACNAPAEARFGGAAKDGSRIFFSTTQQLVNGDTDETNDIYACDIPPGNPTPVGKANSCASLSEVSGASTGADASDLAVVSPDGSRAYFTSRAVLAANPDALGETAVADENNLYLWQKDAAHPAGVTIFVGKFGFNPNGFIGEAQTTPDGRYFVFATPNRLVESDTDDAVDVYRYDAETGEMIRLSTNVFGVGGNGNFEVLMSSSVRGIAISDDGSKVVFDTAEALSPVDGNDEFDYYLWSAGHVSLISTASVGQGIDYYQRAYVDGSGKNIFFETAQPLAPEDGDTAIDVYDARIGGGFSHKEAPVCSGEACQPAAVGSPATPAPASDRPGAGNVTSKRCAKGKVLRNGRCVKKQVRKKHKKAHKKGKRAAGADRGGGK
jgi:hypothetical protein